MVINERKKEILILPFTPPNHDAGGFGGVFNCWKPSVLAESWSMEQVFNH